VLPPERRGHRRASFHHAQLASRPPESRGHINCRR
jgi:hypothetical protein